MHILIINGTVTGTKTRSLVSVTETYISQFDHNHTTEQVHLEDYDLNFADGRPKEEYTEDTTALIKKIEEADGYIIISPVFQGSIPGVLKNMFDLIQPKSMRYKPVAIIANGGSMHHHMVMEYQLKPILDYLRCLVTPNYVYTHTAHFSYTKELIDDDVKQRIHELSRVFLEYLDMSRAVREGDWLNK
ncbi:NADPH-dependent FMN reductase [Halalkalibacillus halophilus]|uniref:NADPH-dependent FMN reductase n=1 Tax=Halalkalibacillus halophilus TaxID=392827 RepID=UPI0004022C7E|nr:NAD(P)H-dependent oxidoreductase [Halalkalibacillus halophilus]